MENIIGIKKGKFWALAFNTLRENKDLVIVYGDCGHYSEILTGQFESELAVCPVCPITKSCKYDGRKFGRWTVIGKSENLNKTSLYLYCKCECGVYKNVAYSNLINGLSKSCGCLRSDLKSMRGSDL